MSNKPIFYRLTEADLPLVFAMTGCELKVYLWLSVRLPFSDSKSIEIDTAQLAEEIGVTRRSIQMALKALDFKGVFDVEITKAKVKRMAKQISPSEIDFAEAKQISPTRNSFPQSEIDFAEAKQISPLQPETITTPAIQPLQTSKTFKDLNQTLSEVKTRERDSFSIFKENLSKEEFESFWDYAMYVAKSFKPTLKTEAIRLPEAWIKKYHQELYNQFLDGLEEKYGSRNFADVISWHNSHNSLSKEIDTDLGW